MRAKIFLADSAEVREGLLFLLGGGWNQVGPQPQPFAVAGLIEVQWEEINSSHTVEFIFEDEDGAPLMVPTPAGDQPLKLATVFDTGRPPGVTRGTSFNVPVALPIVPVPWKAGTRYVLRLMIDGAEADRLKFFVRPVQAPPPR